MAIFKARLSLFYLAEISRQFCARKLKNAAARIVSLPMLCSVRLVAISFDTEFILSIVNGNLVMSSNSHACGLKTSISRQLTLIDQFLTPG